MSVDVSFAGATYSVPEEEDVGWGDLTDYLVALSDAQAGTFDIKSVRINTTGSDTLSASTDYALGVNYAGGATVTLPVGTDGQVFVVFDASGDAVNNVIVVGTSSGQTINGASSYSIRSNWGAVQVMFNGTEWSVLNSRNVTVEQNTTNLAIIDNASDAEGAGVSVTNLQSSTFTFRSSACEFLVMAGDKAMKCCCSVNSPLVDCLWDTDSMFLPTDSGTGVVVTKAASTVTVKNRLGTGAVFKIRVMVGQVTATTAWS